MPLPHFLRALSYRNYRLFFIGQGISLTGTWMTTTALSWLGYELSDSALVLGVLACATQLPVVLFGPIAGVWSDRGNRRHLLIAINIGTTLWAASFAVVTLTGRATVPFLIGLALIGGMLNAVEYPTRQSFLPEMLGSKRDLPNAIAMNSSMFQLSRLIGPTIAGIVIVARGPGLCFVLDAVSCLPILGSLLAIRPVPKPVRKTNPHPLAELRAGLHYAWHRPSIRSSLTMVASTAMVAYAATMLAPVFVKDLFHADARVLGQFYAAMGAGALVSAVFLATRHSAAGLGTWITRGAILAVVGLIGYAVSGAIELSLACLVINGIGAVLVMAGNNTLLQEQVDDEKRGLVMGLFVMAQGLYPVGSLIVSAIANSAGPRLAIAICAIVMAIAAWRFHRGAARHAERHRAVTPALEAPSA